MRLRWRQYDLLFCIALFFMLMAKDFPFKDHHQIERFKNYGVHYSYVLNGIVPFLISHVLPVALLFVINLWLLPRYLYKPKQLVALPIAIVIYWLLLSIAFTIANYYKRIYITVEAPSEIAWPEIGSTALAEASITTIILLLYCFLREPIIQWVIQDHAKRPFRIMLCNKIVSTAFVVIGILLFGIMFNMLSDTVGIIYLFVIVPAIIINFINIYGLFPYRDKMRLTFRRFWPVLLIAPLVLAIVSVTIFTILSARFAWSIFFVQFFISVLIANPVSWLIYTQQRQKLSALLQLQKDLGKTTADLAFLRSQINPHFLFNTLNTLYGTALQENASRTAEGVQRLGDMMRFMLHENNRNKIPLKRELEYLNNYIALQQLRIATSKDISIQMEIGNCTNDHLIAPMLLVPFVENAFKHGIRLTTPSFIKMHFYCDEKGVYLDVINSLHPKRIQEGMPQHSGVGLQNVKERLQLIYPNKYTLQIQEDDTAFTVHLYIQLTD